MKNLLQVRVSTCLYWPCRVEDCDLGVKCTYCVVRVYGVDWVYKLCNFVDLKGVLCRLGVMFNFVDWGLGVNCVDWVHCVNLLVLIIIVFVRTGCSSTDHRPSHSVRKSVELGEAFRRLCETDNARLTNGT